MVAQAVEQRAREICLRMALGANRTAVRATVLNPVELLKTD